MSTRGFLGIKEKGKISGKYNHGDSYYSSLGKEVVDAYFTHCDIMDCANNKDEGLQEEPNLFLYDGLYCEYGYVYNVDNDTLEVYRGFFHTPQFTKEHLEAYDKTKYYVHLVFIADRKIHTKKKILKAMEHYDDCREKEISGTYPERDIINICSACYKPIKVGLIACSEECKEKLFVEKI